MHAHIFKYHIPTCRLHDLTTMIPPLCVSRNLERDQTTNKHTPKTGHRVLGVPINIGTIHTMSVVTRGRRSRGIQNHHRV